ncbi:MAG: hypothetical protein NXI04_26880 [Planctomycetaceae bacterium]|nr:hypothetical protein [Planctomycetaceae bacterium]
MSNAVDYEQTYADGLQAARLGNTQRVNEAVSVLSGSEAWRPQVAILTGLQHKSAGRYREALVSLAEAQQSEATREESFLQAGLICYELKEFREAISLLQRVTAWNADNTLARRMLAAAFYDIGAMDQALDEIGQVTRLAPEDYRPHFMKGEILKDYEQFQLATGAFSAAADLAVAGSTGEEDVRVGWSECLVRLGRYSEALDVLKPLQATPVVMVRRAQACYFLRQYDEARTMIEAVLPQMSDDIDAVTLAVSLYEQERDYSAGMQLISSALKRQPRNIRLLSAAADVFGAAGQQEQAAGFRERSASIAELQQRFSELHQAAVQDIDDVGLRLQLADVAEQLGKPRIARTWLEAAVGMAPQDDAVQQAWTTFREAHADLFDGPRTNETTP